MTRIRIKACAFLLGLLFWVLVYLFPIPMGLLSGLAVFWAVSDFLSYRKNSNNRFR